MALDLSGHAIASGVVYGLVYGSVLGAIAAGLTLIWGVMKVVNLAHGHSIVFAAMVVANMYVMYKVTPPEALPVAIALGAVLGAALYYASLHKVIGQVDTITLREEMATLMTTFGFGLMLFGSHYIINHFVTPEYATEPSHGWSLGNPPYLDLAGVRLEKAKIAAAAAAIVVVLVAHLLLTRTRLGLYIRAVAQDSRALALVGVNPVKVKFVTTVLALTLAGAAGGIFMLYSSSVTPETEFVIGPLAFVVVVLGGLGSVLGGLVGGLILGVVYQLTLAVTQQAQAIALAVAFLVLVLVLIFRPQGLFGRVG